VSSKKPWNIILYEPETRRKDLKADLAQISVTLERAFPHELHDAPNAVRVSVNITAVGDN
jgi:hypothetical protein